MVLERRIVPKKLYPGGTNGWSDFWSITTDGMTEFSNGLTTLWGKRFSRNHLYNKPICKCVICNGD